MRKDLEALRSEFVADRQAERQAQLALANNKAHWEKWLLPLVLMLAGAVVALGWRIALLHAPDLLKRP